jgi:hypothetical protein
MPRYGPNANSLRGNALGDWIQRAWMPHEANAWRQQGDTIAADHKGDAGAWVLVYTMMCTNVETVHKAGCKCGYLQCAADRAFCEGGGG